MNEDEQTRALLARMRQDMPALQGIGVDCLHLSQDHVRLAAPLARNQNDKQTAFAGSLTALGMLCGWALTQRTAAGVDAAAQCAIFDVQTRFRQPVRGDLMAEVRCEHPAIARLRTDLQSGRKARWTLDIQVGSKACPDAVQLRAAYAAWLPDRS